MISSSPCQVDVAEVTPTSITRLMLSVALAVGLVAGLAVVNPPPAYADPARDEMPIRTPSVSAQTSATSVQVAETFSLTLTVSAPVGSKVTFPSTGEKIGDFDVVDTQDSFDIPDAKAIGQRTWRRRLTLESIVTGDLRIEPLEFQVSGLHDGGLHDSRGKNLQVLRSEPIAIHVASVLEDRGDPTQYRDIQSVIDVPVPTKRSNAWLWWSVGGSAGLACFAATGLALSRRRRWVTPKEWALGELDELESSIDDEGYGDQDASLPLSMIISEYLLMEFEISESGLTPQEIVRWIFSTRQADKQVLHKLNELFELSDKAKFGGFQISPAGLKSAIGDSRELVRRIAEDHEMITHRDDKKESI